MHLKSTNLVALFIVVLLCNSCNDTPGKADQVPDSPFSDSVASVEVDTLQPQDTVMKRDSTDDALLDVSNWKTEDFIVSKQYKTSAVVQSTVKYVIGQVKNVSSPFVATYKGCDVGDYFHLNFEDSKGKRYDFGYGNNHFGEYMLYDSIDITDNPKYLGKTFLIYWNWEVSSFPCCDGEYDLVEAYVPSITRLELADNKAH